MCWASPQVVAWFCHLCDFLTSVKHVWMKTNIYFIISVSWSHFLLDYSMSARRCLRASTSLMDMAVCLSLAWSSPLCGAPSVCAETLSVSPVPLAWWQTLCLQSLSFLPNIKALKYLSLVLQVWLVDSVIQYFWVCYSGVSNSSSSSCFISKILWYLFWYCPALIQKHYIVFGFVVISV